MRSALTWHAVLLNQVLFCDAAKQLAKYHCWSILICTFLIRFHMHDDWVDTQGMACFSKGWRMFAAHGLGNARSLARSVDETSLDSARPRWLAWSTSMPVLAMTPSPVRVVKKRTKAHQQHNVAWARHIHLPDWNVEKSISPRRNQVGISAHYTLGSHTRQSYSAVILGSHTPGSCSNCSSTGPAEPQVAALMYPNHQQGNSGSCVRFSYAEQIQHLPILNSPS